MNKRTVAIIAVIIAVAILIGVGATHTPGKNGGTTAENGSAKNSEAVSTEDEDPDVQGTKDPQKEEDTSAGDKKEDQGSGASDQGGPSGTGTTDGSPSSGDPQPESGEKPSSSGSKESGGSTSDLPTISFPYAIAGTDLVVERVSSYDGYYVEDGSDKKVKNIAAIVLTNKGGDLEFAGIGISQGTRSLGFSASQIPAGATVIIQEQNKASYSSDPYYSATATTRPADKFEMSEKLVTVKDNGNNGLTVTNISDKKLSEVKVFFKSYLPDEKVYVGGITYTITLNDLEKGTSTDVSASHYESKHSVVVEVQAK